MLISIKTFDGHAINDGISYKATGLTFASTPQAQPAFITQMRADSVFSGAYTVDVRSVPLSVQIVDYANRHSLLGQLKNWLKPGASGDLVVTFTDENKDYSIPCVVQSFTVEKGGYFTVVLQSGSTSWKAVTASTDTWSITGTGDTKTVTVGGKDNTRLIATLTPTSTPTSGYLYQNFYKLIGNGLSFGLIPYCISLDTAALVTAAKMLPSCYDLRVFNGATELKRWIVDANTNHTKIWFNINMGTGYPMMLYTAIDNSSAVSSMVFYAPTVYNSIPKTGTLANGGEYFNYTGWTYSVGYNRLTFTGVTRAAYNTTKTAHNAKTFFYYVENFISLMYGNSAAEDPAEDSTTYDLTKPLFDLTASDNTKWVYTASTLFRSGARTGNWIPFVQNICKTGKTEVYDYYQDADTGNPALGMTIACTPTVSEQATIAWTLYHPAGVTKVTTTGQKYTTNRAKWITSASANAIGLQKMLNVTWVNVWHEVAPTANSTWQSFTHTDTFTAPKFRFAINGSVIKGAADKNSIEIDTCTVEFVSANCLTGSFVGEKSNYTISVKLENTTTGDAITLRYQMLNINNAFLGILVDGEDYSVKYNNVSAYKALDLDDPSKDYWLSLQPGANVIKITAAGIGTMDAALSWYQRRA